MNFDECNMAGQGLENVYDRLRTLRMTDNVQDFIVAFNSRLARCLLTDEPSNISDFRRALPSQLAAELDKS
jgi:hypothetical protein